MSHTELTSFNLSVILTESIYLLYTRDLGNGLPSHSYRSKDVLAILMAVQISFRKEHN